MAHQKAVHFCKADKPDHHRTEKDMQPMQKGRRGGDQRAQCVDSGIDGYSGRLWNIQIKEHMHYFSAGIAVN